LWHLAYITIAGKELERKKEMREKGTCPHRKILKRRRRRRRVPKWLLYSFPLVPHGEGNTHISGPP
jgi:hypothetical protein